MADAAQVAIAAVVFSLLFLFVVTVGVFYYRQDRFHRLEMLVAAVKSNQFKRLDQTVIGRAKERWMQFKVVNQFLQLLGLLFLEPVPFTGSRTLHSIGSVINLDFGDVAGSPAQLSSYWIFWIVYMVHFATMAFAQRVRGGESLYRHQKLVHRLLVDSLFIPSAKRFLSMLDCVSVGGDLVVERMTEVTCWESEHIVYVLSSLFALGLLYPATLKSALDPLSRVYVFVPRYNISSVLLSTTLIATTTLLSSHAWWAVSFAVVLLGSLTALNLWLQPCLGHGRYINHWTSASLSGVTWASISAWIALIIDDSSLPVAIVLCFVLMPPIMVVAYRISVQWQATLDARCIKHLQQCSQSEDVEFQKTATSDMVILSLSSERRQVIANQVLDPLLTMFVHPKTDAEVRVNVAKSIANLSHDAALCKAIFQRQDGVNILRSLVIMINPRRHQPLDARRAAMQAMCNMTFTSSLCPSIVSETKAISNVIDMLQHSDPLIRETAAQTILNLASSKSKIVEGALLNRRTLGRIVRLFDSKSEDLQILGSQICSALAVRKRNVDILVECGALDDKRLVRLTNSPWYDVRLYARVAVARLEKHSRVVRSRLKFDESIGRLDQLGKRNSVGVAAGNGQPMLVAQDSVISIANESEKKNDPQANNNKASNVVRKCRSCCGCCGKNGCACWAKLVTIVSEYVRAQQTNLDTAEQVQLLTRSAHIEQYGLDDAHIRRAARALRKRTLQQEEQAAAREAQARERHERRKSRAMNNKTAKVHPSSSLIAINVDRAEAKINDADDDDGDGDDDVKQLSPTPALRSFSKSIQEEEDDEEDEAEDDVRPIHATHKRSSLSQFFGNIKRKSASLPSSSTVPVGLHTVASGTSSAAPSSPNESSSALPNRVSNTTTTNNNDYNNHKQQQQSHKHSESSPYLKSPVLTASNKQKSQPTSPVAETDKSPVLGTQSVKSRSSRRSRSKQKRSPASSGHIGTSSLKLPRRKKNSGKSKKKSNSKHSGKLRKSKTSANMLSPFAVSQSNKSKKKKNNNGRKNAKSAKSMRTSQSDPAALDKTKQVQSQLVNMTINE
eukprot:TRINITY_DN68114_c3_g1_i4.p1 TRINITY_DN68114_c3_g1~~TRINITY_DN68114_c3_g1_i4.p1  ORF type:complete len:1070 (+),score=505.79 TRINITY_DN68114_c3_g1_i4:375-3584(+)